MKHASPEKIFEFSYDGLDFQLIEGESAMKDISDGGAGNAARFAIHKESQLKKPKPVLRGLCVALCLGAFLPESGKSVSVIMDGMVVKGIKIPEGNGNPVLTDGLFSEGEWDDAAKVDIQENMALFIKKYRGHVFIGIKFPARVGPAVDLFLSPGEGVIHQLHVSAQLGERILSSRPEEKDPQWTWGRTIGWYANEFRWDEREIQRIIASENLTRSQAYPRAAYPCDGAEFQIKESKFNSRKWRMRISITVPPDFERRIEYPPHSTAKNTSEWVELLFDGA